MHKLSQSLYKSWPVFQALRNLLSICKKLRREKIPSKNRWKPFHQFNVILMAALRCQSIFFRFWSAYIAGTKTQISDIELQKSKWWPRLVFWPANTVTDTWVFPSHCFRFPFLFLPLHCLSQRQRVEVGEMGITSTEPKMSVIEGTCKNRSAPSSHFRSCLTQKNSKTYTRFHDMNI